MQGSQGYIGFQGCIGVQGPIGEPLTYYLPTCEQHRDNAFHRGNMLTIVKSEQTLENHYRQKCRMFAVFCA